MYYSENDTLDDYEPNIMYDLETSLISGFYHSFLDSLFFFNIRVRFVSILIGSC
jgi:hypothetical protein